MTLGRRDGLHPGINLSVFREGRELRHPRTGQVLGRTEQPLGHAAVTAVFETYATVTLTDAASVQPGDRLRLSAGKIRLGLLALSTGVKDTLLEAAVHELTEELGRSGRFQVSLAQSLAVSLAQAGTKPADAFEGRGLAGATARLGVDYVVAALFERVEKKPHLRLRVFGPHEPATIFSTALFVPSSVKPPVRTGQFSADPRGGRDRPASTVRSLLARLLGGELESGSYSSGADTIPLREVGRFGFPVLAMDVAVAPADKVPRVAITDGERVYVYRVADQKLAPEWTFSGRGFGQIISLQLADLDGDGALEAVANRWDPKAGLSSFVLGIRNGKPEYVVNDVESFLFAVDSGRGVKDKLWAQRFSPSQLFAEGQVDEVVIEHGRLRTIGGVLAPSAFRATGAVTSNIAGKDRRALAFVDRFNRLQIAVDGQDVWQSSTQVGGGTVIVELQVQIEQSGRSFLFKMEPPPLGVDLDGDGIEEVVVPQNVVKQGLVAVVFRGPAGFRLQSVESGFEGMITGLGAFRVDESQPTLVASVVRFGDILKRSGETVIIMTVPPE